MSISLDLADSEQTENFARQLANKLTAPCVIYLSGDLGAGKTTLVRALLRQLGVSGAIKSPTFTLVEPYYLADTDTHIYHFDLYRLTNPEELHYIGIRDYVDQQSICLIEWPDKGEGEIPPADLICELAMQLPGRRLTLTANSEIGQRLLQDV